jgi:hypothetical protein
VTYILVEIVEVGDIYTGRGVIGECDLDLRQLTISLTPFLSDSVTLLLLSSCACALVGLHRALATGRSTGAKASTIL